MGYYSTVKTQDLLSLVQFQLNVIVEVFSTVQKTEFHALTSELGRGCVTQARKDAPEKGDVSSQVGGDETYAQEASGAEKGVGFGDRLVFTSRHLHVFGKVISYIILNFFSKVGILLCMLQGCYEDSISAILAIKQVITVTTKHSYIQ